MLVIVMDTSIIRLLQQWITITLIKDHSPILSNLMSLTGAESPSSLSASVSLWSSSISVSSLRLGILSITVTPLDSCSSSTAAAAWCSVPPNMSCSSSVWKTEYFYMDPVWRVWSMTLLVRITDHTHCLDQSVSTLHSQCLVLTSLT